jgi:hypothetical protein
LTEVSPIRFVLPSVASTYQKVEDGFGGKILIENQNQSFLEQLGSARELLCDKHNSIGG